MIFDGYERRRREEWAKIQRISWITAQVNSRKKIDPDDVVNLRVFDSDYDPPVETEENHEEVKARVKERQSTIARMLAAQMKAENTEGPAPV